ncbi:hypothetical protein ACFVH6_37345 [Spirillospora sp. NPDC127200]
MTHPLAARPDLHPGELHGLAWVTPRSSDAERARFRAPAAIALVSMSADRHYARSGVVIVPLRGDHHCTTVLAWRREDARPSISATVEHLRASL